MKRIERVYAGQGGKATGGEERRKMMHGKAEDKGVACLSQATYN